MPAIGILLIVVPFLVFYVLPTPCWLEGADPGKYSEYGMSCTYSEILNICDNPFFGESLFGMMISPLCSRIRTIQYAVWIVMAIGFVVLITRFR